MRSFAFTRREFLVTTAASSTLVVAPGLVGRAAERKLWSSDPFSLGVASGSPAPDGFVLWTRLAPEPESYDPDSPAGMSGGPRRIAYEIAGDPALKTIVKRGTAVADPHYAYSVHAEIEGLLPGRPYWYRFMSGDAVSPVGRAMTRPALDSAPDGLRFGFVSCANYEHGYFSAYRHLADEEPDVVLFLGDYIYEYVDTRSTNLVRRHSEGVEAENLATYRNRYAQYRLDPDLKRLHASAPALTIWDDHEVQNDYANQASETFDEPAKFLQRRAAAYQAFYEHMPLRAFSRPNGAAMRIYDRLRYGNLLEISLLDGRQYRSREACYREPDWGGAHPETNQSCPERLDPSRSMIGEAQESWLFDGLAKSRADWNLIAQDVLMAQLRGVNEQGEATFSTDDWDGYPESRSRLLRHVYDARVRNAVVIGGDIHSFWTNDLKLDFDDPASPAVATEFVGTSVSTHGVPYEVFARALPDNPHVKFFESRRRGYVAVELTRQTMTAKFRAVSDAQDPAANVFTLKTFVVESGKPGAVEG